MRHTMLIVALLAWIGTGEAAAMVMIDADTTIDYDLMDTVRIVEGAAPPTIVDVVDPAFIELQVDVCNESVLNVLGGRFSNDVVSWDQSTVNVEGGRVGYEDTMRARGQSTVNIRGGSIGDCVAVYDTATVNFFGGGISEDIIARDHSTVRIAGGSGDDLWLSDDATATVEGGSFGTMQAEARGRIRITGGGVLSLLAGTATGGHASVITVEGTGFNYPYGPIPDATGTLTGTLASGEAIDAWFAVYSGAAIVLVPEPATLALVALGTLALCARRPGRRTRAHRTV